MQTRPSVNDLKVHTGTVLGLTQNAKNNLKIAVSGTITPAGDAPSKTVAWKLVPSSTIQIPDVEAAVRALLVAAYPETATRTFVVTSVIIPNISMVNRNRSDTYKAEPTNESKAGATCVI